MSERKPCRCLLAESAPDLAASVAEYIALLSDEEKTEADVRARRLECCLHCDHLRDGTCALCGCYVEARTAKRRQRCPDLPPKWT